MLFSKEGSDIFYYELILLKLKINNPNPNRPKVPNTAPKPTIIIVDQVCYTKQIGEKLEQNTHNFQS